MVRIMPAIGVAILSSIPLTLGFDSSSAIEPQIPVYVQPPGKLGFDLNKLPYCFFWTGDIKGGEITYELAAFDKNTLEKSLRKQGIVNPNETKEAIKYINDEVSRFNKLISGKEVNVIEKLERKADEPILKPSVSPYESVKKYHLGWCAYPIILEDVDM